jgi:hypothetical protein
MRPSHVGDVHGHAVDTVQDLPTTVINTGTGTATVAPLCGTLTNLSGATGNLTLTRGQRAEIISPDGTNFQQVA